jgi:hypothetical protein
MPTVALTNADPTLATPAMSAEVIDLDAIRAMLRLAEAIDRHTEAVKANSAAVLEASIPHGQRVLRTLRSYEPTDDRPAKPLRQHRGRS